VAPGRPEVGFRKTAGTVGPTPAYVADQGSELAKRVEITLATKMDISSVIPTHRGNPPWQRESNETTNGLLRQYLRRTPTCPCIRPKPLLEVSTELNTRPRKTLGGIAAAKAMQRPLLIPKTHRCDDPELGDPLSGHDPPW
jgi:IS30 family transposase